MSRLSDREMVVSDCSTYALSCVGVDSQCRFLYEDGKMKDSRGVAVDRNGNIYVCANGSHVLHQVAPDGTVDRVAFF